MEALGNELAFKFWRSRDKGHYAQPHLESAYYLYREWLPTSGEDLRDFPLFFHYLNLIPETPEHELLTDVYLPLK